MFRFIDRIPTVVLLRTIDVVGGSITFALVVWIFWLIGR